MKIGIGSPLARKKLRFRKAPPRQTATMLSSTASRWGRRIDSHRKSQARPATTSTTPITNSPASMRYPHGLPYGMITCLRKARYQPAALTDSSRRLAASPCGNPPRTILVRPETTHSHATTSWTASKPTEGKIRPFTVWGSPARIRESWAGGRYMAGLLGAPAAAAAGGADVPTGGLA